MPILERLGRDLIIRIPAGVARKVGFTAGMKLEFDGLVDQINVRPAGTPRRRNKFKLSDMLRGFKGPYPHKDLFNDPPVGRELI